MQLVTPCPESWDFGDVQLSFGPSKIWRHMTSLEASGARVDVVMVSDLQQLDFLACWGHTYDNIRQSRLFSDSIEILTGKIDPLDSKWLNFRKCDS